MQRMNQSARELQEEIRKMNIHQNTTESAFVHIQRAKFTEDTEDKRFDQSIDGSMNSVPFNRSLNPNSSIRIKRNSCWKIV